MTNRELIQNINPKIVKYQDSKYYLAINSFLGFDKNSAYTLFLSINDKIFADNNDVQIFLYSFFNKSFDEISELIANGIEGRYEYGEDYSISWSLYQLLSSYGNNSIVNLISNESESKFIFPDLFDSQFNIINRDKYETVADTNLYYFWRLNNLIDSSLTDEELNSFVKTFCKIILENTTFDDFTDIKNSIYKMVLNYYANGGNDDTVIALNLLLGSDSLISGSTNQISCCSTYTANSSASNNGTNSSISSQDIANILSSSTSYVSCKDNYMKAMFLYLVQMLSDIQFYCDWFMIHSDTGDSYPNLVLIDKLKQLFEEFKGLNYDLSFGADSKQHSCKCDGRNKHNDSLNDNNWRIIDNYYKVLEYVENDEIEENCNKIKVYGKEFAEILPYLIFI